METTNKSMTPTERSKAYEIILSGLKKMINEQSKSDGEIEGVPLPLERQVLWKDPNEQILSVDKNFDLLIEYIKEKQANRNVDSQVSDVLTKLKIAENAKLEYIKLYNEIADELRVAKLEIRAKEKHIESLKAKIDENKSNQREMIENELKQQTTKRNSELMTKLRALENLNDELNIKNEELTLSFKALNTTVEDQTLLKEELAKLEKENSTLKATLAEEIEKNTSLLQQVETMKAEVEAAKANATLTTLDESISFQEDTTMVEMESHSNEIGLQSPKSCSIESEKRVRFLHGLETTQQMLADMNASERIKKESVLTVAEIREAKHEAEYTTFLEKVKQTRSSPNLSLMRQFLFLKTYYDRINVPQHIEHSQDWSNILYQSYRRLTEEELSQHKEEIEEAYYVLSSFEHKIEYDLLLKTLQLFKDSFYTSCFKVKVKETKQKNRKNIVSIKSEKKFIILNPYRRRVYVLNKQVEKYPTHLKKGELSFRLKDIVDIKLAKRGALNLKKVRIKNKKFDAEVVPRIVEISFTFKDKKQKLFMLVDTTNRAKEIINSLESIKRILSML